MFIYEYDFGIPIVLALEAYTITLVLAHANGIRNTHNTLYYPCMVHKSKPFLCSPTIYTHVSQCTSTVPCM